MEMLRLAERGTFKRIGKNHGFDPRTGDADANGDGGFNINYDGIGNSNRKLGTNAVASLSGAPTRS